MAFAEHIEQKLMLISDPKERQQTVLLFSAHSIPLSVVNRGDPYPVVSTAVFHSLKFQISYFAEHSFFTCLRKHYSVDINGVYLRSPITVLLSRWTEYGCTLYI